jgi:hypothetical protein
MLPFPTPLKAAANFISQISSQIPTSARKRKAGPSQLFQGHVSISSDTRILDLSDTTPIGNVTHNNSSATKITKPCKDETIEISKTDLPSDHAVKVFLRCRPHPVGHRCLDILNETDVVFTQNFTNVSGATEEIREDQYRFDRIFGESSTQYEGE